MPSDQFTVLGLMGESNSGKDFSARWIVENQHYIRVGFADVLKRFLMSIFQFDYEQLWGEPSSRNREVEVNWFQASSRFLDSVAGFVGDLPLSMIEKADYLGVLGRWFNKLKEVKQGKESLKVSPRLALQLLGTEYGRGYKQTIWSDYLYQKVVPRLEAGHVYSPSKGVGRHCSRMREVVKSRVNGIVIPDHRFLSEIQATQEFGGFVIKIVRLANKGKENEAEKAGIEGHASEAEQRGIPDEAFDLVLEMGEGPKNVYPRLQEMFERREWEEPAH